MNTPIRNTTRRLALAALMLMGPGAAAAFTTTFGSLDFIEPEGVVGQHDDIPVWLRFTLGSEMPAVIGERTDVSLLDPQYFPSVLTAYDADGNVITSFGREQAVLEISSFYANVFFTCSGTFTTVCTEGPPYDFGFDDGPASISAFNDPVDFRPGEAVDLLLGTFRPTGGMAPLGQYFFYGAGLFLDFQGSATVTGPVLDEFGNPVPLFKRDGTGGLALDELGNPIPLFQRDDAGELVLDESGHPIPLFKRDGTGDPVLDEFGNPVPLFERDDAGELVLDGSGNPIPLFQRDEAGELVLDESGNPIPLFERDGTGELVLDEFGDPIPLFERDGTGELVLDEFGDPIPLFERDDAGELVLDEFGDPIPLFETATVFYERVHGTTDLGRTACAFGPADPSCAGNFSRVVVPVPAAAWLLASALGGTWIAARRRRPVGRARA